MSSSPAVHGRGLEVRRGGNLILRGLDFDVTRGALVGLLGPSGSGKTTLMRAILGVQRNVTGTLSVLGEPAGEPSLRGRVAYLTQTPAVYSDLTVAENLRYFARLLRTAAGAVEDALTTVDLAGYGRRIVATLSGGEVARVALASALLGGPDLVVLDEPTVGLDPVLRRDLWGTFRGLAERGVTLLVSSHVMDEAERCDRVLLLRNGRLLADGTPEEIRARTGEARLEEAFLALVGGAPAAPAR